MSQNPNRQLAIFLIKVALVILSVILIWQLAKIIVIAAILLFLGWILIKTSIEAKYQQDQRRLAAAERKFNRAKKMYGDKWQ